MGLGDMVPMLWSFKVVEDDRVLKEYCMFDHYVSYDLHFQNLLDIYGGTVIALQMIIVARLKNPITAMIDVSHFDEKSTEECRTGPELVYQDLLDISLRGGNIFFSITFQSNMILLEQHLVGNQDTCNKPFSAALDNYYVW
eukprot:7160939-Ditylum_brightwellii.AAC.1